MPKVDVKNHGISYSYNGVSSGSNNPTIVLIHGAGGQEVDWPKAWRSANAQAKSMGLTPSNHGVIKLFNAGLDDYSIYAVDLPGHGNQMEKANRALVNIQSTSLIFSMRCNLRTYA